MCLNDMPAAEQMVLVPCGHRCMCEPCWRERLLPREPAARLQASLPHLRRARSHGAADVRRVNTHTCVTTVQCATQQSVHSSAAHAVRRNAVVLPMPLLTWHFLPATPSRAVLLCLQAACVATACCLHATPPAARGSSCRGAPRVGASSLALHVRRFFAVAAAAKPQPWRGAFRTLLRRPSCAPKTPAAGAAAPYAACADAATCAAPASPGGADGVDDGKIDASFHSPAYLAAHIASLQARQRARFSAFVLCVLADAARAGAGDGAHHVRRLQEEAAGTRGVRKRRAAARVQHVASESFFCVCADAPACAHRAGGREGSDGGGRAGGQGAACAPGVLARLPCAHARVPLTRPAPCPLQSSFARSWTPTAPSGSPARAAAAATRRRGGGGAHSGVWRAASDAAALLRCQEKSKKRKRDKDKDKKKKRKKESKDKDKDKKDGGKERKKKARMRRKLLPSLRRCRV